MGSLCFDARHRAVSTSAVQTFRRMGLSCGGHLLQVTLHGTALIHPSQNLCPRPQRVLDRDSRPGQGGQGEKKPP